MIILKCLANYSSFNLSTKIHCKNRYVCLVMFSFVSFHSYLPAFELWKHRVHTYDRKKNKKLYDHFIFQAWVRKRML